MIVPNKTAAFSPEDQADRGGYAETDSFISKA
jgi:hypothetical protein